MKVDLTIQEAQFIIDCVDTHVKAHGLKVAANGAHILSKLQQAEAPSEDEQSA